MIITNGEWIRNWKEVIVMYVKASRLFQSSDRRNEAKPPTICGNITGNSLRVSPETVSMQVFVQRSLYMNLLHHARPGESSKPVITSDYEKIQYTSFKIHISWNLDIWFDRRFLSGYTTGGFSRRAQLRK
jgi:hypothetical protein